MTERKSYSIEDEGYFGVTILKIGSYGAYLMRNRVDGLNGNGSRLFFDEADAFYHEEHGALTVEGSAKSISTPAFAVSSLEGHAKVARDLEVLVNAATK